MPGTAVTLLSFGVQGSDEELPVDLHDDDVGVRTSPVVVAAGAAVARCFVCCCCCSLCPGISCTVGTVVTPPRPSAEFIGAAAGLVDVVSPGATTWCTTAPFTRSGGGDRCRALPPAGHRSDLPPPWPIRSPPITPSAVTCGWNPPVGLPPTTPTPPPPLLSSAEKRLGPPVLLRCAPAMRLPPPPPMRVVGDIGSSVDTVLRGGRWAAVVFAPVYHCRSCGTELEVLGEFGLMVSRLPCERTGMG